MNKLFKPTMTVLGILIAALLYAQTFNIEQPQGIKYVVGTSSTDCGESGAFPGQLCMLINDVSDPVLYAWNQNDGGWEVIAGDGAYRVGQLDATGGSATAPSLIFGSDADTGINLNGANDLRLYMNGTLNTLWTGAQTRKADGSASAPSYSWNTNSGSGMYYSASIGTGPIFADGTIVWGSLRATKTSFTAAQVQGMTTPVDITTAPGAGYVHVFHDAVLYLNADGADDFAGVAAGEDFQVVYETSGVVVSENCDTATCLDLDAATADTGYFTELHTGTAGGYSLTANQAKKLQLQFVAGDGVTGGADNDLEIVIRYVTLPVNQ